MSEQIFGEIHGVTEGQAFKNRKALMEAKIHRVLQAGIDGNPTEGSSSIVLNGGFVDDYDLGDVILYTGHGENDPNSKRQVSDQNWDATGNKALIVSQLHGLPVRVTRGYKHKSNYSPKEGYQYGGIYYVTDHFQEVGIDGYRICRYVLIKETKTFTVTESEQVELPKGKGKPKQVDSTVVRTVRDTKISKSLKELYDFRCQVCDLRLTFRGVGYAEGAHIRPLSRIHGGEDDTNNLLCLCPNHHTMFDYGAFTIADDFSVIGLPGELIVKNGHDINQANLRYHREHIYTND
jgi:putative restriction endonuclease